MIISTPIYLKRSPEKKSSENTTIETALKELRNEKENKRAEQYSIKRRSDTGFVMSCH